MGNLKIIWTNTAKEQLKTIFYYYSEKSTQAATNIKDDILKTTKEIHFVEQYQRDEIEPEFRRIIVRHYKILYKEYQEIIFIARILDTRQEPNKQIKK